VNKFSILAGFIFFAHMATQAGDAVAIGYNADGVWTSVTYYSSSTPKGGHDYKTEKEAREEALRDLRARAGENLARSSIISASDLTGYAAVGRGKNRTGRDENVVGYGKSQREADEKAFAQLNQFDAARKRQIIYRYFSYGADSKP
jgi:hypothetical protein